MRTRFVMLERVRKVVEAIFGFPAVFEMLIALAATAWAVFTFASLLSQGKFDEAATAYILVATIAMIIVFGAWIYHDARRSSERLEKHLPNPKDAGIDEISNADDCDADKIRPCE